MSKRIGVFCGSSKGKNLEFEKNTVRLGEQLGKHGFSLVYGGGSWGLMGSLAQSCRAAGMTDIIEVIPSFMMSKRGETIGRVLEVESMSIRKETINKYADTFVILPGGFGTLDELIEMLTWNQIGINNKIVAILNLDGYFDGFKLWMRRAMEEGFVDTEDVANLGIFDSVEEVMAMLLEGKRPKAVPSRFQIKH